MNFIRSISTKPAQTGHFICYYTDSKRVRSYLRSLQHPCISQCLEIVEGHSLCALSRTAFQNLSTFAPRLNGILYHQLQQPDGLEERRNQLGIFQFFLELRNEYSFFQVPASESSTGAI